MPLHLFIDTNVYLSFYHFSSDDIESIDNLVNRVSAGDIVVHLPQQVENEWERNREIKLSNAADASGKQPRKPCHDDGDLHLVAQTRLAA